MMSRFLIEDQAMKDFRRSGRAELLAAGVLFFAASLAAVQAETVMTINDADIDSVVVDLYIENRIKKPANQASAAEREAFIAEIVDIYLLTTQPHVAGLMDTPNVKAQLEIQKRGIMAQVVATDFVANNQASGEEILSEYATQIELAPPKQFKASHILVETQAAAIGLIGQLDEGADFGELARENSTDPSGPNDGDLGWFSPNKMVKPFSDAVSQLADGEYTKDPVQTQFGWHVIRRDESRDSEPPTLESVRDVIKQRIEQQKLQEHLAQLREANE